MRPRLLALDMDGTLLRTDGEVDPRDRAAIGRAVAAGVTVTIATGRLATGALPTARALGLEAPLVCADGAVLVCGATGARLEQTPIALAVATRAMRTLAEHALAPFVLLYDAVHCDESGREHCEYVSVWTQSVTVHPRLSDASGWQRDGDIAMAVGIGSEAGTAAAHAALERDHGAHLETVRFRVHRAGERWALLMRPRGCHKAARLARLAERLGVSREDVAAVGDWHNDVTMLRWAGRSFAMGQAPQEVRDAATDTLRATAATGGGVAEAVDRWLRG